MRRTLIATLAFAALCGSARGAAAQSVPSPFRYVETRHTVGFFGGYLLTDPGIAIRETEVEMGPQSAPLVGVRYGLRFGGPLSGEASLAFSPTERTVFVPSQSPNPAEQVPQPAGTRDMALLLADAGVVFHLTGDRTWRGLAPFLVGSGGLALDLRGAGEEEESIPETARFDFGPSFAVGAGIGTDWFPTRRLSVRAEVRDRLWQIEAPQGLRPADLRTVSEWTNNVTFSLGAALHF